MSVQLCCLLEVTSLPSLGQMDSITIAPGKTMKIIATIVGPIKRFVDMEVLVTQIDSSTCPIEPQVGRLNIN